MLFLLHNLVVISYLRCPSPIHISAFTSLTMPVSSTPVRIAFTNMPITLSPCCIHWFSCPRNLSAMILLFSSLQLSNNRFRITHLRQSKLAIPPTSSYAFSSVATKSVEGLHCALLSLTLLTQMNELKSIAEKPNSLSVLSYLNSML